MVAEEFILRPIEDTDVGLLHELLNDSSSQQLVGGSVMPMSKTQVLEWLQAKRNTRDTYQFGIEAGGGLCGYAQLVGINRVDGHATLGINILSRYQGQGLGKAALQRLHEFAKHRLLLRKIVLYVRSDNDSAINVYLKLGYQQVGTLAQHVKTVAGYVDLQIMEIMF